MAAATIAATQISIAKSAGVFHWTSDGRKLYDYTSGVLVSNLGHNPADWQKKFLSYMGWTGKLNGKGYPDGLSGEQIPLASRITLACDAHHAMLSSRPYRAAMRPAAAVAELRENS